MKIYLVTPFLLLSFQSLGQKDSSYFNNKAVKFSVFLGPAINYRKSYSDLARFGFYSNSAHVGSSSSEYVYYSKKEKAKFGYQLGTTVSFRISNLSRIKMGMIVNKMGYKTGLIDTVYSKITTTQDSTYYAKNVNNHIMDYSTIYFSFPLIYSYTINKHKYSLSPNLGLAFDALFSFERTNFYEEKFQVYPPKKIKEMYRLRDLNRPFYLSLMAGFDVEYPLKDKYSLSIEPQFKYVFYHMNKKTKSKNLDFSSPEEYLDRTMGRIRPSDLYAFSLLLKFNF